MLLYALTIFLSAFLLFQIQPIITKMIVPWFGGVASVWITAMFFFQMILLGGYLYAHWSIRSLAPKSQTVVHAVLLTASLLVLPVAPSLSWKTAGTELPILRILGLLTVSVGLPYFLLSTTTPLVQAWYARTHKTALPYRLFSLSNLASLMGLLSYPVLVEPHTTLRQQSLVWSTAYGIFVALGIALVWVNRRPSPYYPGNPVAERETVAVAASPPGVREMVLWLLLAAGASTLLLSTTNHLTENVSSIPFLWVLPLGLYLLTFILTFDYERLYHRKTFIWLTMIALGGMAFAINRWGAFTSVKIVIPAYSAGLFICCLFCHGELVRRKPHPRHLTSFYLMLSLGGALGGLLVGLLAPAVLRGNFELPFALALCAVLLLVVAQRHSGRITKIACWAISIGVIIATFNYLVVFTKNLRVMDRNFYGSLRVLGKKVGTPYETRALVHGRIIHGEQYVSPVARNEPLGYYSTISGVAHALKLLRPSPLRIGVIGLGAGTLSAYAEPNDVLRFYEINPLVEKLARTEFTYLADCRGHVEVVLGDGRLSLEGEPAQHYDLLVVDAFNGDAIPVHLLTKQAMELYFRNLKPTGILALHLTNNHLDLAPVVKVLAQHLGKHALFVTNESQVDWNISAALWALVSSERIAPPTTTATRAWDAVSRPDLRVWTDDYNNLFQILR
jgi:spermidine synthase